MAHKKKKTENTDTCELELYIRNLFAGNLKRYRSDHNLSQMELGLLANISTNFVNEIENERKWPSVQTLAKLVKALSVEPADLFTPEAMIKISEAELFKMKLISTITNAVNESIDSAVIDTSKIESDYDKPAKK